MSLKKNEYATQNSNLSLVTTATVDYVPQALVTLRSAYSACSFRSIHLFVADATAQSLNQIKSIIGDEYKWLHIFGPDDLGAEKDLYLKSFLYYNPFEVANVAKYVGVSHVLRIKESGDICVFIDADTYFTGDICNVVQSKIQNVAAYLSPHILGPLNDNLEHDILIHGWINTGISAFNRTHPDTASILNWLTDRISKRGFCSPHLGMFVDQLWMSTLPILFHNKIVMCDNPGINVAYWNLIERPLTKQNQQIYAANVPLLMFHFSGFLTNDSTRLSKHANIQIENGSILDKICTTYREELKLTERIRPQLDNLATISHSEANLHQRITTCTSIHREPLYKTMVRPGVFTKLGSKIDAVIRKFVALTR